jgi:regulator of nucleoside diphosphate kinase
MTQDRKIAITYYDYERLQELIENEHYSDPNAVKRKDLKDLANELGRAQIVNPTELPADVITMNSVVELRDLETDEALSITLVFPTDADYEAQRISVLAPVGVGMLGYRVGDLIEWPVPRGVRRFKVEAITYQPEAAGHFHL